MRALQTGLLVAVLAALLSPLAITHAAFRIDNFPRSGNQYLVAGTDLVPEDYGALSRFDLLVLPAEAQIFNPDAAAELRRRNPDIQILAYVPTVSYNTQYWTDPLHTKLRDTLTPSMRLRDPYGQQVSVWPGTYALNIANNDYRSAWVNYVRDHVWSSGYWDGIFLDEVSSNISWVGPTDLAQRGITDNSAQADLAWKNGYVDLFARTRAALGPDAILISNGSSDDALHGNLNGRMFESFPTPWEGNGRWETIMQRLFRQQTRANQPDVFFLNGNTNNTGVINYKDFRFGLTSALLGGAFFGYDYGTESHAQLWVFDEYEAFLGRVVDTPKDELNPNNVNIQPSVWSRDFQHGKILVNATDSTQTIPLNQAFEKINGSQDRTVNDGRIVTEVTLEGRDGIVLLRPLEELIGAQFSNGSFVRIFNNDGTRQRTGFFSYTGATLGGNHVVRYDMDNDGAAEIITADNTYVRIHSSTGEVLYTFAPYGDAYRSGINLAVGDLENDGRIEIVTGTKNGGGPHIRIFNHEGVLINPGFFAYGPGFRGGVQVTLGDVDGDGNDDIIAGAGVGGGPHVRIFNKDGVLINPGFFAFDDQFRGGVHVSAGDVTGDGVVDIITGPGAGGRSTVRVYSQFGELLLPEFEAFPGTRDGVDVAATDLDGDGIAEIMALTTDVFTLSTNEL